MWERSINEQRAVCKSTRCAERKAACRGVAPIQSRGLQSAERRRFPHAENRREEAGHKAGFIALAEKTHQQSRAEKNRKQPITTARTHYSLSEQFLFENRRFPQFKSQRKSPKNATLVKWSAERSKNANRTNQAAENHGNLFLMKPRAGLPSTPTTPT